VLVDRSFVVAHAAVPLWVGTCRVMGVR